MLDTKKAATFLRRAILLLAAAAAILQTLAVILEYDVASGANYFRVGAILPHAATACAILGAILSILWAVTLKGTPTNPDLYGQRVAPVPAALGYLLAAPALLLSQPSLALELRGATVLLLVAAAACTLLLCTSLPQRNPALAALLGMVPTPACIALNAYYYFDVSVEMNAPLKVAVQLGLLAVMLVGTAEVRYLLARPLPRLYLMLCGWLCSLGALSALALPVAYLLGRFDRVDYAAGAVLTLCTCMGAALRMRHLLQAPDAPADADAPLSQDTPDEL